MLRLLIVADDFTGALDTGVQFASRGAKTKVVTDPGYDLSRAEGLDVLIFDSESRHLTPTEAYKAVNGFITRAKAFDIPYIYKKTDSGLRGNIGGELAGAMDALGLDTMAFVPAFPAMKRTTKGGIHYIDGVPVAESMFGRDPFEPVKNSNVNEIIAEQTDKVGIKVYDAEIDDDMYKIASELGEAGLRLTAGCAGFAGVLAGVLGFNGHGAEVGSMPSQFFMICGSVNPVTQAQVKYAASHGFRKICLSVEQKLNPDWPGSAECINTARRWLDEIGDHNAILDANDPNETQQTDDYIKANNLTMDQVRLRISHSITGAAKALLDNGLDARLMCVGGDTLLALMRCVGVFELIPICEIARGVVLTSFAYGGKDYYIMTKSGGFGDENLLVTLF